MQVLSKCKARSGIGRGLGQVTVSVVITCLDATSNGTDELVFGVVVDNGWADFWRDGGSVLLRPKLARRL